MAAVRLLSGLRLAIAALERQAERDLALELRADALEEREDGTRCGNDGRGVARRNSRQRRGGAAQLLSHGRCEAGLRRTGPGGRFRFRAERLEAAAGRQKRTLDLLGRRPFARGFLQLTDGCALKIEEARSLVGLRCGGCGLLAGRCTGRDEGPERAERRGYREREGARAGQCAITMTIEARGHLAVPLAPFWTTTSLNRQAVIRPPAGRQAHASRLSSTLLLFVTADFQAAGSEYCATC